MGPTKHPDCYFAASAFAAVINFPLWKASAQAQSGFGPKGYLEAVLPPYRGVAAVLLGMTWARGAIFYGSDTGKSWMLQQGWSSATSTIAPTLFISTIVQIVNQPIVRASITIQNPMSPYQSTLEAVRGIAASKGILKLWHGTSAGIMKTVPKYCIAIACKDAVEARLPKSANPTAREELARSALKSVVAGVCGAALTNPLDVLRNEMFKTDLGVADSLRKLVREERAGFLTRGVTKNLVAVAIPITITIFTTDALVGIKRN